mgnify:CR=1 FL=1
MMDKINKTISEWLTKDETLTIEDLKVIIPTSIGKKHNLLECKVLKTEHGIVGVCFAPIPDNKVMMFDTRQKMHDVMRDGYYFKETPEQDMLTQYLRKERLSQLKNKGFLDLP